MKTLRTLLTWGLLSAAAHVMGYSLTVSPIEIEAGQTANLIINLDDAPDNFTAYQMMVYLPDGVTVQKKTNGKYAYTANADRHDGNFTITVKDAADGSVLIACFSADKDVLTGTSGELIRLPLEVASTVTTSLQGSIKNIEFSDVNNNAYNPADVNFTMTLKGGSTPPDVSGDVTVSVPDIEITAGSTADLIVNMQTELTNVTAYQLMVYLPDGVTVQKKTNGKYAYTANADRHDGAFTITVKDAADGSVLIACFSADKDVLTGASGELIRLPLEVASTVTTSLQGSIKNIEFSDVNNNAYNPADVNFAMTLKEPVSQNITFADPAVKAICVANWDTNGDGELSKEEAAAVTDLGKVFRDNTEITSFNELQYFTGLTRIIYSAFYNCSRLTSVVIPESVTSIGKWAFYGCSGLTSVNIPESVTSISPQAFENCSILTSITIPNSVTSIGSGAFSGTAWYDNQPDGLVYAGKVAYRYKGTMPEGTEIVIKDGTLGIADGAFWDCSGLTSITIPSSVTSIGSSAFEGCSGLTSVTIPNSVTSIGDWAFEGCRGLISVTIPNSVTSIGSGAFRLCDGLTSITIPESVTSIGSGAFRQCGGLTSIKVESGNTVYDSRDNCNAIIETASNTLIAGCMNTLIPENVTRIGYYAFSNANLASITIPNSVTSIGEGAFWGCLFLRSVIIGSEVKSIGVNAFYYCWSLTSIIIPESVTKIYGQPFEGCANLISIVVELGNNVYDSRDNCNAIIETASNTLIAGCMNTIIPMSVTGIGEKAFYRCEGLTSVTIPNSVTSIGSGAFSLCDGLTSITIPESVTSIGINAFYGCSGLTSITIPESVTSIGNGAFEFCRGLTSVTIGSGVTSIGSRAFYGCSSLQSIICYATETPEVKENTFNGVDISNVTLQVPRESVQKYKDHLVWGKFKIEVIDGIEDVRNGESGEDFERSIYDLSGQRLPDGRMPRGIFIRNGKKIAVK